jgi:hypothetical protein
LDFVFLSIDLNNEITTNEWDVNHITIKNDLDFWESHYDDRDLLYFHWKIILCCCFKRCLFNLFQESVLENIITLFQVCSAYWLSWSPSSILLTGNLQIWLQFDTPMFSVKIIGSVCFWVQISVFIYLILKSIVLYLFDRFLNLFWEFQYDVMEIGQRTLNFHKRPRGIRISTRDLLCEKNSGFMLNNYHQSTNKFGKLLLVIYSKAEELRAQRLNILIFVFIPNKKAHNLKAYCSAEELLIKSLKSRKTSS